MTSRLAHYNRLGEYALARVEVSEPALGGAQVRVLGPHHLHTLRRRSNIVRLAMQRQDFDTALERALRQIDVCSADLGPTHGETLAAVELVVSATAFARSLEDAETIALTWYDRVETAVGPTDRSAGRLALLLYNVYDSWDGDARTDDKARWLELARASDYRIPAYLDIDRPDPVPVGGSALKLPRPIRSRSWELSPCTSQVLPEHQEVCYAHGTWTDHRTLARRPRRLRTTSPTRARCILPARRSTARRTSS